MERKKSLSSSSGTKKTRTSLVVCCRGERERHAHQRRVFEEVVRCVAHPRFFGFAFWSRDLLVVANAAKNTGNAGLLQSVSLVVVVCVSFGIGGSRSQDISSSPFLCVWIPTRRCRLKKGGEFSIRRRDGRQLFDHHHHHRHHETTKGGFSRASFSFVVVVVVVVVVVRDYTRRRRSFSTLMMRRKSRFWFFVSQSLFLQQKNREKKKALKKENSNNNIAQTQKYSHT